MKSTPIGALSFPQTNSNYPFGRDAPTPFMQSSTENQMTCRAEFKKSCMHTKLRLLSCWTQSASCRMFISSSAAQSRLHNKRLYTVSFLQLSK